MFNNIEFSHAFQPVIDISERKIVSHEVLLRGINNEGPAEVFGMVDKKDIYSFDQYSREKAISLASRLGLECSIHLNFSPNDILLSEGTCIIKTIEALRKNGFVSKQLIVEITENEIVENYDLLAQILNKVRQEKIVIAIDDFGAGYAGLNLLATIQPDLIKVDMTLLRNINENGPRQAIVRAINEVCLDLGIDILAEGVESEHEFKWLKSIGITLYQGFLFAKPEIERLQTFSDLNFQLPFSTQTET